MGSGGVCQDAVGVWWCWSVVRCKSGVSGWQELCGRALVVMGLGWLVGVGVGWLDSQANVYRLLSVEDLH